MSTNTIEVGSMDIERDALVAAIEDLDNNAFSVGWAYDGDGRTVRVTDDGFNDDDMRVIVGDDVAIQHIHIEDLKDKVWPTFKEYLRENVFTLGNYVFDPDKDMMADTYLAENDDGSGVIINTDLESAFEDENVEVREIRDGFVGLNDLRG